MQVLFQQLQMDNDSKIVTVSDTYIQRYYIHKSSVSGGTSVQPWKCNKARRAESIKYIPFGRLMFNQYAQIISKVQTQVKLMHRISVNTQSHLQCFYQNVQVTYVHIH